MRTVGLFGSWKAGDLYCVYEQTVVFFGFGKRGICTVCMSGRLCFLGLESGGFVLCV